MKELPRHQDDLGQIEAARPVVDWTEYFRKMGIEIPALPEPLHPLRDPLEFVTHPQSQDYPWQRVMSQMRDLLNGAIKHNIANYANFLFFQY